MRACVLTLVIVSVGCASRALPFPDVSANESDGSVFGKDLGALVIDAGRPPLPADIGRIDSAKPFDLALLSADMATSSISPCLTGGSVAYLSGDPGDWIHPGVETIQISAWIAHDSEADTFRYTVESKAGWSFAFSSKQLGQPLAVGRYDNAMADGSATSGHPAIEIEGDGRTCSSVSGWFQIESISGGPDNGSFHELTAIFEQQCDGLSGALRGCVHFEN